MFEVRIAAEFACDAMKIVCWPNSNVNWPKYQSLNARIAR